MKMQDLIVIPVQNILNQSVVLMVLIIKMNVIVPVKEVVRNIQKEVVQKNKLVKDVQEF